MMPVRAVFEADSPEELHALLRTIAQGGQPSGAGPSHETEPTDEPSPLPMTYAEFKARRPEIAQQILTVIEEAGGRMKLRELEQRVGRSGYKMAGTLGALAHASNSTFGALILLAQPWFSINGGQGWDREYVINPDIYRPED